MTTRKDLEIARAVAELLQPAISKMVLTTLAPLEKQLNEASLAADTLRSQYADAVSKISELENAVALALAESKKATESAAHASSAVESTASVVVGLTAGVSAVTDRVSLALVDARADARSARETADAISDKYTETVRSVSAMDAVLRELPTRIDRLAGSVASSQEQLAEKIASSAVRMEVVAGVAQHAFSKSDRLELKIESLQESVSGREQPVPYDDTALKDSVAAVSVKLQALSVSVDSRLESVSEALGSSQDLMSEKLAAAQQTAPQPIPYDDAPLLKQVADLSASVQTLSATMRETTAEASSIYVKVSEAVESLDGKIASAVASIKLPDPIPGPEGTMGASAPYAPGEVVLALGMRSHAGGLWQAKRETTDEPATSSDDWSLVVDGIKGVAIGSTEDEFKFVLTTSGGSTVEHSVPVDSLVYKGVYDPAVEYRKNTAVTYGGSLWISKSASVGTQPGSSGGVWQLAVKRGSDGKSIQGEAGESHVAGFAGEYFMGASYIKDSVVHYAGSVWLAKRQTEATPPYVTREDNDDWLRIR